MNGLLSSYLRNEWLFSYDEYQNLLKDNTINKSDIESAEVVNTDSGYKMKVTFKNVPLDLLARKNA